MTTPEDRRREDEQRTAWRESVGGAFAGAYAVLVISADGTRTRRRLFCSLASAERSMRRAHERGDRAALSLVRVSPVTVCDVVDPQVAP